MHLRPTNLWRNSDFLKLWIGQTISEVGSRITLVALPLIAVLVLNATPFQMGLLAGIGGIASLIFGLADRLRRRPILIVTYLGRAVVLGSIPLAASFKISGMRQVYVVVATAGMLTVVWLIRNPEARVSLIPGSHVWQDFTNGLRAVTQSPIRRAITGHSATAGFFMGFFASLFMTFAKITTHPFRLGRKGMGGASV